MNAKLPSALDISPTRGQFLDEKLALEHFLGKSVSEATELFRENSVYYLNDLMWMGSKAFAFYLPAFLNYLRSADIDENSDDMNHFVGIIEFRLEHEPQSIAIAKKNILAGIDYCLENYSKFGVDLAIYGDLRSKLIGLRNRVSELATS